MKYIKKFEKFINLLPEDSEVILLYVEEDDVLPGIPPKKKYVNDIFTLIEVDNRDTNYPYYIVNDDWMGCVRYDQIRLATIEEIKQYEIRKNMKKYNL